MKMYSTMEDNYSDIITPDDWVPTDSLIKVVGVGGGGCNAVTYMYEQKIEGCTFIVCNTDRQSLVNSSVPVKIQLGAGRGAGTNPIKGRNAAIEAEDLIEKTIFTPETEMLFITAGMGGGTGTGATPVIASMAKKRGILTVAVVTLPFQGESNDTLTKAIDGIHELESCVDSLLIINNEKIYDTYPEFLIQNSFPMVDQVLATAVRGVVDIIQNKGYVNVDFEDVKAVMKDSGMALLGCGTGRGENRIEDAIRQAMESPLLNDYDLTTAKNTLINITVGYNDQGLMTKELKNIDSIISKYTGNANRFKRGIVYNYDDDFGDRIDITVIATGFKMNTLETIIQPNIGNIIVIGDNFKYDRSQGAEEVILTESVPSIKIGHHSTYNVRKFHFTEENMPVLAGDIDNRIGELETVPAIERRKSHPTEEKN